MADLGVGPSFSRFPSRCDICFRYFFFWGGKLRPLQTVNNQSLWVLGYPKNPAKKFILGRFLGGYLSIYSCKQLSNEQLNRKLMVCAYIVCSPLFLLYSANVNKNICLYYYKYIKYPVTDKSWKFNTSPRKNKRQSQLKIGNLSQFRTPEDRPSSNPIHFSKGEKLAFPLEL